MLFQDMQEKNEGEDNCRPLPHKLGDKDSNLDKQIQSLLSYRWTIPQQ